jgi:hypothetical protein
MIRNMLRTFGYATVKHTLGHDAYWRLLARPSTLYAKLLFQDKPITATEIGVFAGMNAETILENLNVETLYLVDPYKPYLDARPVEAEETNKAFRIMAHNVMAKHNGHTRFLRMTSDEAVNKVPNYQDFIYVDGLHTFAQVTRDMEHYYPKLKQGGLLAGHDYNCEEVQKAVDNFTQTHGIPLLVNKVENTTENGWENASDWIIVKREVIA